MPYSKADMVSTLAKTGAVTKEKAGAMLDALADGIAGALKAGEAVDVLRIGRFTTVERGRKAGRNLRTGETMSIPPCTAVRFAAAPRLKALLNPGYEGAVTIPSPEKVPNKEEEIVEEARVSLRRLAEKKTAAPMPKVKIKPIPKELPVK